MKIGIDLGGSHIGLGVVDEGKIIQKREIDLSHENNTKEEIENYIVNNLNELIKRYKIDEIGIAVPGTIRDGKITQLVNLKIKDWNLKLTIENTFKIPVEIRNDAKCAAIAEKQYGVLKEYEDCVFLCLGTGIGASVFLEGKQLIPKRNPGFEIGHMIIEKDGLICNCGKRGCFETYCSMKRLKENLAVALNLENTVDSKELIQILENEKNNQNIQKIIQGYLNNLVIGMSNIIDIFEPEVICLGGSFAYFENILFTPFLKIYEERKYAFNKEKLPIIKLASLKNDSGIIGATL